MSFSTAAKRLAKLAPRGSVGWGVPVERSTFIGRFVIKLPSRKVVSLAIPQGERQRVLLMCNKTLPISHFYYLPVS